LNQLSVDDLLSLKHLLHWVVFSFSRRLAPVWGKP
jgi:hypothetical protein